MQNGSNESAENELKIQIRSIHAMESDKVKASLLAANVTARNILREEIGHYGEYEGERYYFNDETRDRLVAHARQDAANAMLVASRCYEKIHVIQKSLIVIIGLLIGIAVGLGIK